METERLVLKPPAASDAPALRDYFVRNDARFARWRVARSHELDDHVRRIAEEAETRSGDVTFLAFAEHETDLVAVVVLNGFSVEEPPQAMLAYTVDGAYEGRGYAREAVGRVVQFARDELGLGALSAFYDPANERSERLLTRLGFEIVRRTTVVPGFEHLMRAQNVALVRLT